jgi:hypothetical protein
MTNDTTSTKETVMKTQFSIEMYQVSHGKLPRGKGCWGFATEKMPSDYSNVYFSQYLPLSAAKKGGSSPISDRFHALYSSLII